MTAELVERFERPSVRYGPLPLWWWSGERLDLDRLRWQMDQLTAQGVCQAVVMNLAPTGPLYGALADDPPFMSPEWWEVFTGVLEHAERTGFQIWLYDQIGFSGANLQGRIVAANPQHAGRTLSHVRADATSGAELVAPAGSQPLGAWFVPDDGGPSRPVPLADSAARSGAAAGELVLAFATTRGFDYFSPAACAELIDAVYGEYRRHVGEHFGTTIGGAFQDELPDVPTWSADFPTRFRTIRGYDVLEVLPALFGDPLPDEAPVEAAFARLHFHSARATLAREAFFDPLAAWLEEAGLPCGFDQQSPAREGMPIGAVEHYGDYLQTHAGYAIPGSDHWGDARIHSSLAHAHGHERVWIEAFHSSGWGGTLEETYDWLAPFLRRGATLYDPHAVYYSTRSGWFEWAPPSTCWRQPYWSDYHAFAGAIARLCSLLVAGHHVASTLVLYPTETVQAHLTADGRDLGAAAAQHAYLELNGLTSWFAEQPGVLDRAGWDYDVLTSTSLTDARVEGGELRVGHERYRNVVLPAVEVLPAFLVELLGQLADDGGTVVCIGAPPSRAVPDGATHRPEGTAPGLDGRVWVVGSAQEVVSHLQRSAVAVEADVPVVHRQVGDAHVVVAFAHDHRTGTVQPMLSGFDDPWASGDFDWPTYWHRLSTEGYRFVPPAGRRLHVRLHGVDPAGHTAQRWDPRTGERTTLPLTAVEGGAIIECEAAGSATVLVVAPDLPPAATRGAVVAVETLDGPWTLTPESTLDNRWGDLAERWVRGTVPVQVWRFAHRAEPGAGEQEVLATFGPFAEVAGPDGGWRPLEWSASRGIHDDPIHDASLGPNGYVPEEFILVRGVVAGDRYRVRTTIEVPQDERVRLAVGANAARALTFDGATLETGEPRYLSFSEVPTGRAGTLEIELTAAVDGDLRAFFALTTDVERFARPEWIEPADGSVPLTSVTFTTEIDLAEPVPDARVQLSTESPSTLLVNGVEIARQSDFDPYAARRFTRVHAHDLRSVLRPGRNRIEVRCTDIGRPAAIRLDSVPAADGGLGLLSGSGWRTTRDGAEIATRQRLQQHEDPRYGCLVPRPHPLQAATWLETEAAHPSVLAVVPDMAPGAERTEELSFAVPLGAVAIEVPTALPFEVIGDASQQGNRIVLAAPAAPGTRLRLRFRTAGGRRGGALLDGPLSVQCASAEAGLAPWSDLGLADMGGAVRYQRTLQVPDVPSGGRVVLDLGTVRGSASVEVDGEQVASLFAGPWRADLTDAVGDGAPHTLTVVVRGTLAPYLAAASPTSAVMAGQCVHGLFGPVRLEIQDGGS